MSLSVSGDVLKRVGELVNLATHQAKDKTLEWALEYYEQMLRLFKVFTEGPEKIPVNPSIPDSSENASRMDPPTEEPSIHLDDQPTPPPPHDTPESLPETPWVEVAKIGAGCVGTLYFTHKAYQSIRKWRAEKKEGESTKRKIPSWLPPVAYTAAAVCSAVYTVFNCRNF